MSPAGNRQTDLEEQSKIFAAEVRQLASRFPDLEGHFALTRPRPAAPGRASKVAAREARRCLAWGIDPVTGKKICIRWG